TRIIFIVVVALLLCGGVYLWSEGVQLPAVQSGQAATTSDNRQQASLPSPRRSPENTPADAKPVPVVAATVHQGSVPVYISGLGTVQALYTINIKAQVDGVILKMPFAEGQDVKEGDTLVLIDPSVYQAKLEQAQA